MRISHAHPTSDHDYRTKDNTHVAIAAGTATSPTNSPATIHGRNGTCTGTPLKYVPQNCTVYCTAQPPMKMLKGDCREDEENYTDHPESHEPSHYVNIVILPHKYTIPKPKKFYFCLLPMKLPFWRFFVLI